MQIEKNIYIYFLVIFRFFPLFSFLFEEDQVAPYKKKLKRKKKPHTHIEVHRHTIFSILTIIFKENQTTSTNMLMERLMDLPGKTKIMKDIFLFIERKRKIWYISSFRPTGASMHIIEGRHKVRNHKLFPLDRWHLIPSALQRQSV